MSLAETSAPSWPAHCVADHHRYIIYRYMLIRSGAAYVYMYLVGDPIYEL